MAYTMTQMHEHDLFVRAMGSYIPASKVWVEVRGWEDPRPQFVIQFKNGVRFEGDHKPFERLMAAMTPFTPTFELLPGTQQ